MQTSTGTIPGILRGGHADATTARRLPKAERNGSVFAMIARWIERRRSRIALLEMNDAQLKDIGISRADAYQEGIRPFWD